MDKRKRPLGRGEKTKDRGRRNGAGRVGKRKEKEWTEGGKIKRGKQGDGERRKPGRTGSEGHGSRGKGKMEKKRCKEKRSDG